MSERAVADVLDDLHIQWEYEPRLFVLEEDEQGNPKFGFRPDFYIPKLELYIEVTMAKQANITVKHRKIRVLREKYPGTRIELICRHDFDNLRDRILEILSMYRNLPDDSF